MPASVHRIEVRRKPGQTDPRSEAATREAKSTGLANGLQFVEAAAVYLIDGPLDSKQVQRIAQELLADPVTETAIFGASPHLADSIIEVHPLPGVMDPDAEAVELAIRALLGVDVQAQTGRRFDLRGADAAAARRIGERAFANTLIHAVHDEPYQPPALPRGVPHEFCVVEVPLRDLSDEQLKRLSREAHLFLSVDEMKAIQAEYSRLGREPREIELETLAQTWSEHCVHKTFKSTIRYREAIDNGAQSPPIPMGGRPGHEINPDGSVTIHNLLKSTIAAATHELIAAPEGADWCLSVFVDNAGVIAFDDDHAVCFKVETHNHPSALEPYGGAATGIGGCIRDVIGTGLSARPIAATDIFCVAPPDLKSVPAGCLHPRRILTQVVAGVRDYGNRMGIPTLNGAVWFDEAYVGNPLVYCGVVGVMPRDKVKGKAEDGDHIIALGGRTGRDGIHGATFSSAELTDAHADEFAHAVQIGNPITEKKLLDAILAARDSEHGCLFNAITDCGAGGFSSAVGEMGAKLGATVHLDRAPLKYDGLSPTEIWISEAQERMILAVPAASIPRLRAICEAHEVELSELGQFGTPGKELILQFKGDEVGRLSMDFLHDGLPETVRDAAWSPASRGVSPRSPRLSGLTQPGSLKDALLAMLAHPNIASKHWIVRQYDHEVQGRSVVRPLIGANQNGPSDAAVIQPVRNSSRGLAIACGLATNLSDDPYVMALAAIDECVRNLVCVGADPDRIAILDNFCWPSCSDPRNLGALVRAAEGCYDAAKAHRTPFISGKDSLNNQFTTEDGRTIQIPPTLLISGIGIVPDITQCVTMDAKRAGNALVLVGPPATTLTSSHYAMLYHAGEDQYPPRFDLESAPRAARAVHQLIQRGLARSAHDCSDGGLLVAAAEMCIAGSLGLAIESPLNEAGGFGETAGRYLIEIDADDLKEVSKLLGRVPHEMIGRFNDSGRLTMGGGLDVTIEALRVAWMGTLDW